LARKFPRKILLERSRCKWEINIKTDFEETGSEGINGFGYLSLGSVAVSLSYGIPDSCLIKVWRLRFDSCRVKRFYSSHHGLTGSDTHPISYPMSSGNSFPENKVAGMLQPLSRTHVAYLSLCSLFLLGAVLNPTELGGYTRNMNHPFSNFKTLYSDHRGNLVVLYCSKKQ
jgi:hypothetical protein